MVSRSRCVRTALCRSAPECREHFTQGVRACVDYASVMPPLITEAMQADDAVLTALAHLPTASLREVVAPAFFARLRDADYMRLAVLLAKKSDAARHTVSHT